MNKQTKIACLFLGLTFILASCKKQAIPEAQTESPKGVEQITNERNQFKDLKMPRTARSGFTDAGKRATTESMAGDNTGCVPVLHTQSAEFDKLSVLDPSTDIMYVGSLLDGESIQDGTYRPVFLSPDYERKPVTFSVSIQGSNQAINKTISPDLASFRVAMQEIMNATITGEQPANFTFELEQARSRKEIEMKIQANLKFGTFFSSVGNYNESQTRTKNYYLLKIFQKFFSADINIPADGNLFNKPVDFGGTVAPVYISTIDYGRSAYLLIESSYDSLSVFKSLEASFSVWKIGGGTTISNQQKAVMDNMKISGTVIGGSSSGAAATIGGMQAFHDYVVNSGTMGPNSRGEVIAYKLRNAKNHGVYKTLINGDYYALNCSALLAPVYAYYSLSMNVWRFEFNIDNIPYLHDGSWTNKGIYFYAYKQQIPGTVPVYEFYAPSTRDCTWNQNNLSDGYWQHGGTKFYAYPVAMDGAVPVYSYYHHRSRRSHYMGQSAGIPWPQNEWTNEGVIFYAK